MIDGQKCFDDPVKIDLKTKYLNNSDQARR